MHASMVARVLLVVQVLVLPLVFCPLVILYILGLYLSAGISLWRLIQHDYGNPDGGANLKPALNILYSLAVAQGVVYSYRTIYDVAARTELVKEVARWYSLETDFFSEYLDETVEGCRKDPSFARGRNLVTYAVDLLMESKSRYGYISGVLILGGAQRDVMKELLSQSASFSHVVQRLVETFGPTSPYSTEIRVRAARIVANVAGSVRLEQFPKGVMIECISSLLDTFEEYKEYERDWLLYNKEEQGGYNFVDTIPKHNSKTNLLQSYEDLVVQGLCILQKLAINEDNCRVIANAQGLLSKTMAHLISNKLHEDHHNEWYRIATESLEFMRRLMVMATLGGTDIITKLRSEVSRILECHKCCMFLKRKAAQVLLQLSPDSIVPDGSGSTSIIFAWILLDIFLLPQFDRIRGSAHLAKKSSDIPRLAGEKMQAMISSKTDTSMLPSVVGDVIGSLARTVAGAEYKAYRIHAAMILKHLCEYYTEDDENLKELKEAVANVMEEVLKEIVRWLTTEENQVVTEANNGGSVFLAEEGLDLEQGGVPHDTHQQKGEQHQGIQLQEALLDLCWVIFFEWIHRNQDLTRQFNETKAKICLEQGMPDKTFVSLLNEAQTKRDDNKKRASELAVGHSS